MQYLNVFDIYNLQLTPIPKEIPTTNWLLHLMFGTKETQGMFGTIFFVSFPFPWSRHVAEKAKKACLERLSGGVQDLCSFDTGSDLFP